LPTSVGEPTDNVIAPRASLRLELRFHEARHELFQTACVRDHPAFKLEFVIGYRHVRGSRTMLDDLPVSRIEALMAFDNARSGESAKLPIWSVVDFRDAEFEIGTVDWVIGIQKVADQERVHVFQTSERRRERGVVGIDCEATCGEPLPVTARP